MHLDVSDEQSWQAAVGEAVATFGPVDVLINNAGILMFADLTKMPVEDLDRLWSRRQVAGHDHDIGTRDVRLRQHRLEHRQHAVHIGQDGDA